MPNMNNFNIKEDRVQEVLRVKLNLASSLDRPFEKPKGIAKTCEPPERIGLNEWFAYIKSTLRDKDKFGFIEIK